MPSCGARTGVARELRRGTRAGGRRRGRATSRAPSCSSSHNQRERLTQERAAILSLEGPVICERVGPCALQPHEPHTHRPPACVASRCVPTRHRLVSLCRPARTRSSAVATLRGVGSTTRISLSLFLSHTRGGSRSTRCRLHTHTAGLPRGWRRKAQYEGSFDRAAASGDGRAREGRKATRKGAREVRGGRGRVSRAARRAEDSEGYRSGGRERGARKEREREREERPRHGD